MKDDSKIYKKQQRKDLGNKEKFKIGNFKNNNKKNEDRSEFRKDFQE